MKTLHYDRHDAHALLPLLGSIGREIQERSEQLERLESLIEERSSRPSPDQGQIHRWVAEAAAHRRGLRLAKQELERLGCSVVGLEPLTFRIPGKDGADEYSFVWQTGDPLVK